MTILCVRLVGDDVLVCSCGQGYVDIRVFDIDNPYDSITSSPLYWTGESSSSSSSSSSLEVNELNQVNYIYYIDIVDIPSTSININDKMGEDIIIVAATNIGVSIGYFNLSKWKIEKTHVIGLPCRYIPSYACIEFLSNIKRVIISIESDIYLSSLIDNIDNNDITFIDRNKKMNIITSYGKPMKSIIADEFIVIDIILVYDHDIVLLVKNEHTSIISARWCKLGINPDQLSVLWEVYLNSDKANAIALNKKAGKLSAIENGIILTNDSNIFICNYTGILCKLSIVEEFGNITSLHIPTDGMVVEGRSYGFRIVTSTSSGNYLMYEFDAPSMKAIAKANDDEPIINNDNVTTKVTVLKVQGAFEPHDSKVLPFIPYCEKIIEIDYQYNQDKDNNGNVSLILGYNHCYGLQCLMIKFEIEAKKLDDALITRSCDFHASIDHISGVKHVDILRNDVNDLNVPDQYLVTCIDDIHCKSFIYKCEMGISLSIGFQYPFEAGDHHHYHSTILESVPFVYNNNRVTAIIVSSRLVDQSSILILDSTGIVDTNSKNNLNLRIIEDDATIFASLFMHEHLIQVTKKSLSLISVKGTAVDNVSTSFESIGAPMKQIFHIIACDKYLLLFGDDKQVCTIKYDVGSRKFEKEGIQKLENTPAAVSAIYMNMHMVAISSWDRDFIDIYSIKGNGEPLSLIYSLPHPDKDSDSDYDLVTVFQHIQLILVEKENQIEIDCFCATTDGKITIYRLYSDDPSLLTWKHVVVKTFHLVGCCLQKTRIIQNEHSNVIGIVMNSNECDYLVSFYNPEHKEDTEFAKELKSLTYKSWKIQTIIKKEKRTRSQLIPIQSLRLSDSKTISNNYSFVWLEMKEDDDIKDNTFLCAGSIHADSKLCIRKGLPVPGIVSEIEIDKRKSRALIHWKHYDGSGIAVIDSISLTCLWKQMVSATDDIYLSNVAIGLRPPVPIKKEEEYDFIITLITKSMTSSNAQVSTFKFIQQVNDIEPIGYIEVDKGILYHCCIGPDLLLIADGDEISIILWEEEGITDTTTNEFLDNNDDSTGVKGPVIIAGRVRNRKYNSSNTKKLAHLGNEATLWNDKKVNVSLIKNCTFPFPHKSIIDVKGVDTCDRNENYNIFISLVGSIEVLKLDINNGEKYEITKLRSISMNNAILSNLRISISDKSLNYQRGNIICIERLTGKLVRIDQLLTNDEKNPKESNNYTTNIEISEFPDTLNISRFLDMINVSLESKHYLIFLDDELNVHRF